MTKAEMLKQYKEKFQREAQEKYSEFIIFMKSDGFIETIDTIGNFALKQPMFYKKISEEIYLVFNLPVFYLIKTQGFHADFWKVYAKSETELLKKLIPENNKIFLMPSFDLKRDSELYKQERSKL